jgi:hypothetical protein
MLLRDTPRSWLPEGVVGRIERLSRSTGTERQMATAALADRLATREAPLAAYLTPVIPTLLAPSLGCRVFPPLGYDIDLAALCLNRRP